MEQLMELSECRPALDAWLGEHADELAPAYTGNGTLDQWVVQHARVKRALYDAGWNRWGWPERVGGLGGSPLLRGYLGEVITLRELAQPSVYCMTEVLAPTMID